MIVPIRVNENSKDGLAIPSNPLPILGSDDKLIRVILCRLKTHVTHCGFGHWESGNVVLIYKVVTTKDFDVGFGPLIHREIRQDNQQRAGIFSFDWTIQACFFLCRNQKFHCGQTSTALRHPRWVYKARLENRITGEV